MRLASSSLPIRLGTPLPGVPTLTRKPLQFARATPGAWAAVRFELRGAAAAFAGRTARPARRTGCPAIQAVGVFGGRVVAAALHEAEIGLALAQQLQVGRRALAGQQHHLDAIGSQGLAVALAEFVVRTLGRAGGQRHPLGWRRVEPPVGQHQQTHRQQRQTARPKPAGRASTAACSEWSGAWRSHGSIALRRQVHAAQRARPRAARTARSTARAVTSATIVPSTIIPAGLPAWPVPSANSVSPSNCVCTGLMARASPSCATCASWCACALVMTASVAITPMVVLVPASRGCGSSPRSSARRAVQQPPPSAVRAPATTCAGVGVDHVAQRIAAISAPTVTPSTVTEAVPMPPFMARAMPNILPTGAPAPAPTLPWAGARAGRPRRPHSRPAHRGGSGVAHQQIKQHGRRHDGHAPDPHVKTDAAFLQPAHHAAGGVQPPRAAAGQHDRVHLVHQVDGREQVGLARAGRGAAHVHAATAPPRAITTVQPVGRRRSVKWPTSMPRRR